MKPRIWNQCPPSVLETLLWDCELAYDHYEGSKEEVIHSFLCGSSVSDENHRIVNTALSFISEEEFVRRCQSELLRLRQQVAVLEKLIDNS